MENNYVMIRIYTLLLLFGVGFQLSAQDNSKEDQHISLTFIGDVMGHDPQITGAWFDSIKGYDYDHCFQYIKPIVEKSDYAVANLELTLNGAPYSGYPQFCSPDTIAGALKNAGFDMLLTSNNHSVDKGDKGIKRTIEVLDKRNIPHTGTFLSQADRDSLYPLLVDVKGCRIAFLNCTYGTNGLKAKQHLVNYIDTAEIRKDLEKAKEKADYVILCIHWGKEYIINASKEQRALATYFFENGADLIIGSHPHVLQEIEKQKFTYKGKEKEGLIYFSHGNFISNQRARYKNGGMISHVNLRVDSTGKVHLEDYGYTPTWIWRKLDGKKYRYYVVPVAYYEAHPDEFKFTDADKYKFNTFKKDTRTHLKTSKEFPGDWKKNESK